MARKTGGKTSKAAAYRDAASALGKKADLGKVHDYIKDKFGIEMDRTQISQYRSIEKGRRKSKRGPKATAETDAPAPKAAQTDSLLAFIRTVKDWENKLSPAKIREVIGVLYQNN